MKIAFFLSLMLTLTAPALADAAGDLQAQKRALAEIISADINAALQGG